MAGRRSVNFLISLLVGVAFFASCGGSHSSSTYDGEGEVVPLKYAENLSITEYPDFTEVTVRNPWDTLKTLQKYILVSRDSVTPENLPQGTVVKVPVTNALVYSTVHNSLISELGSIDAIGGICNSKYVNGEELQRRLASGEIVDCGMSLSPDLEKIIKLNPQVVMLSPFENNDKYAKVGELGIPIIECADYMETSALGRAEWVKFYGMLFGQEELAKNIFAETESNYNRLKKLASETSTKPKVLIDQRYGQVWNVPGGVSTMGRLIEDAGGINPFASYEQSGSVPLAPEKVLGEAHDADVWFVKYNQEKEKTMEELAQDAPVNSRFKAYRDGNVFGCNTRYVNYYEETPFHPDRLLEDMIAGMHPELNLKPRYFQPLSAKALTPNARNF
ncbi:MAG: ABC transporter substrate-binding protein [Muribaculaceae bacterium]|nr:ABC transporter substrate-binding protein [Muribaculaceae bacterium]